MPLRLPKVRNDLEYFEQEIEGEEVVVVRDPIRGTYYKYNPLQAAMLRSLDGVRTLDQMVETLSERFEVEIPRQAAERFVASARERMLLDIASYNVSDARAQAFVLKELKREGFKFRGMKAAMQGDAESRVASAEAVLFMGGIRQLQVGQPSRALDYFSAVLELNSENKRAKKLVEVIQTAYVKALGGASTDFPTFARINPARLLTFIDRTMGKVMFGWVGLLLLTLLGIAALYAYSITTYPDVDVGPLDALLFYALLFVQGFMHEVGHGLACYHYGGRVQEIGITLYYYMAPAPYCDTSSSYLFENRWHKVMVQAYGTVANLIFLFTAIILLAVLQPGVFFYQALYLNVFLVIFGLVTNLIPFLKLDGYYALCDAIGTPNLRERSFSLLKTRVGSRLLGLAGTEEELPPNKRRFFLGFAVASLVFTLFWLYTFTFRISAWIVEEYQGVGLIASVVIFGYLLRRTLIWPFAAVARLLVRERRQIFTLRRSIVLALLVTALVAPWFLIRWPVMVDAEFVLVPKERREVRAEVAGTVRDVLVTEGAVVRRGEPLAVLVNPELVKELRVVEADLEQLEIHLAQLRRGARDEEVELAKSQLRQAMAQQFRDVEQARQTQTLAKAGALDGRSVNTTAGSAAVSSSKANAARWRLANLEAGTREEVIAAAEAVHAQLVAQRDRVKTELALLTIRSPIDGVVATKHVDDRRTARFAQGDTLLEIHDVSSFFAEIRVPASAPLDELDIGDAIALRAAGLPEEKIESRIERIQTAAGSHESTRSDLVVVTSTFAISDGRSGLRGHARLYGRERSLGYAFVYLPLQRLVRVSLWVLL